MRGMLPHQADVCALLDRFAHTVAAGAPPSYAAFRQAWSAMHFSHIFEARAWPVRGHHGIATLPAVKSLGRPANSSCSLHFNVNRVDISLCSAT